MAQDMRIRDDGGGSIEDAYTAYVKEQERIAISGVIQGIYDASNQSRADLEAWLNTEADTMNHYKSEMKDDLTESFQGKAGDAAKQFLTDTMKHLEFTSPLQEV